MNPIIREIRHGELQPLLELYRHLNPDDEPSGTREAASAWGTLLDNERFFPCLVAELGGELVAACSLAIVPNLTRGARSYCLVENVVTHPDHRRKGLASMLLRGAVSLARERGCYKVMLMSNVKRTGAHEFYKAIGFNAEGKKAFFMYL